MPVPSRLACLSALIVQESIFRLPRWGVRLAEVESGLLLLRFPNGLRDLILCASHFEISIALIEKSLFDEPLLSSEGIPPRMRRVLRPIVRIDGTEPDLELERLLLLGCYGFVRDDVSKPSLGRILRAVSAGNIAAPRKPLSGALQRLLSSTAGPRLTGREQEVLSLLAQQLSNRRMAERLFISGETLRWHIRNLYAKTEIGTRAELIEYARRAALPLREMVESAEIMPLKACAASATDL